MEGNACILSVRFGVEEGHLPVNTRKINNPTEKEQKVETATW